MNHLLLAIITVIGGFCAGVGALVAGASFAAAWLFIIAYVAAMWGIIFAVLKVGEKVGLE